jgi:3-phytase
MTVIWFTTAIGPLEGSPLSLRFATYNASLNRSSVGGLVTDLSTPNNPQARRVAEIIQRVRPDVLLINEFDYDTAGQAAALFQQNYLSLAQDTTGSGAAADPIVFPQFFVAPSNTGVSSGVDFDGDGDLDDYGFGDFPGQFGMVVFSRHPINIASARTFREFLWQDMPANRIPDNFTALGRPSARLSSKSHWDLPINVAGRTIHLLASHPTPPVFDSATFDENGRRNADEIRFWADYVDPDRSAYIYDDAGVVGGLPVGARFVIVGDQNSDPFDGDSLSGAMDPLLMSPLVRSDFHPASAGGEEDSGLEGGINLGHAGDPAEDTADFGSPPGNLRVDYVLPSNGLLAVGGGVFWPQRGDAYLPLISASDHRLVYVDLVVVSEPATCWMLGVAMGYGAAVRFRRHSSVKPENRPS